jgi:hypothetical protein
LLTAPVSMLGVALGIAFLLSSFFTLVSLLATAGGIAGVAACGALWSNPVSFSRL